MKLLVICPILISLVVAACHEPLSSEVTDNGVVVKKPYLWKTSISDDGELAQVIVSAPIIYGGANVLVGATKNDQRSIMSLSAQDGTKYWEWSDLLSLYGNPTYKDPIYFHKNTCYQRGNALFFPFSTNSYCINLNDGTTQWKHKINLGRVGISAGLGDTYFSAAGTYGVGDDERLYWGNINSSDPETYLLTPHYKPVDKADFNGFGMIRGIIPFVVQSDTLLAILYFDPNPNTARFRSYSVSSLYNLSKRQWVYERKVMNPNLETGNIIFPILYNSKIYYASGLGLHCYDVMTGEPIWSVPFSQGFGFSGFIIADNKLIANCEDTYTYCLEPATGRMIWQEKSSGTSTPINYLNGVVYFAGGGDGKLHAIDANTGQHLWKISSPDLAHNSGAWFYGTCTAVPGKEEAKGRIVVTTGINAYGYEAIR